MGRLATHSLGVAVLLALAVISSSGPAAAADVTYAIAGVETGFTPTSSAFAGTAVGDGDFAFWQAVVERTPFDSARNATITGGAFQLDGGVHDLQGVITHGTITNLRSNCRREIFLIQGDISLSDPAGGTGHFTATLTHYLTRLHGECVIYFATIDGSVTFSLP